MRSNKGFAVNLELPQTCAPKLWPMHQKCFFDPGLCRLRTLTVAPTKAPIVLVFDAACLYQLKRRNLAPSVQSAPITFKSAWKTSSKHYNAETLTQQAESIPYLWTFAHGCRPYEKISCPSPLTV